MKEETGQVYPLVVFRIGAAYQALYKACGKLFKEKGLPLEMDQVPIVLRLYYRGKASQQDIAFGLQRDKASINRTIAFLQKKELISIKPDAADKRKTLVELTAGGKKIALQADKILRAYNDELSSSLTKQELKQFHTLMTKLIDGPTST